jgi:hypothetical protein
MKKYVLAASLTAGLALVGAPALAQVSGSVGANYSRTDQSGPDTDTYGVNGGVAIPTGGSLAVLLNGAYAHNDDADVDLFDASAHLITRNDSQAWGGYLGYTHADVTGGDVDAWGIGGEYAKFFTNSTLALTLGYENEDDLDVNATGLLGEYRIFATDNLRFDINAGYARVDTNFGDGDGTQIGAGVEYRFDAVPISIGANYAHFDTDIADSNVFGISLRYNFGSKSLKDSDRKGNTFGGRALAAFLQ